MPTDHDVSKARGIENTLYSHTIVAGAGPAGLSAAIMFRRPVCCVRLDLRRSESVPKSHGDYDGARHRPLRAEGVR